MKEYSSFHSFFNNKLAGKEFFDIVDELPFNAFFERPAVIHELLAIDFKNVLDAGCAAGWYSHWFAEHGANVTCLDFNEGLLRKCKERLGDRAYYVQADLNKELPFKNNSFDLILSSLTLDYIEHLSTPMKEFYRILSPGGALVFSVQHPLDFETQHSKEYYFKKRKVTHRTRDLDEDYVVKYYHRTLTEIFQSVIGAGFNIVNVVEPIPTTEFKKRCPDIYEYMLQCPEYLIIRGEK